MLKNFEQQIMWVCQLSLYDKPSAPLIILNQNLVSDVRGIVSV